MAQFSVCASLSFFNFCFQKQTCKILLSFGKRKNTAWLVICLCVLVLLCQQIAAFFYIIITAFYLCVLCEFYYWCLHFLQQKQQLPSSQLVFHESQQPRIGFVGEFSYFLVQISGAGDSAFVNRFGFETVVTLFQLLKTLQMADFNRGEGREKSHEIILKELYFRECF